MKKISFAIRHRSFVKKIIGSYSSFPETLFRIETESQVRLREQNIQLARKSRSYDYTIGKNGLVNPVVGDLYIGPNGMSLRPAEINNWDIISSYEGDFQIVVIPKSTSIPLELVLLHERGDHYSLQTSVPCRIDELNSRITKFLRPMQRISREEYFEKYPLE
jgi:hypothetical protein